MKHSIHTLDAGKAGDIELNDAIYGLEPRADILARVVQWQMNKRRAGTRRTLKRGEVDRTTRKMYKQKGTGQARHGAQSAPQFRGGGRAMGPVVRSHETDLPKKVRKLGLKLALSSKARTQKLFVLDAAKLADAKTKAVKDKLAKLGWTNALIVDGPEVDKNFVLATRNLAGVQVMPTVGLNVYDILRRDALVLTTSAIAALEERLK